MQEPRNRGIVQRLLPSVYSYGGAGGKAFLICFVLEPAMAFMPFLLKNKQKQDIFRSFKYFQTFKSLITLISSV